MKKFNILCLIILISLAFAPFSYGIELKTEFQKSYPKYFMSCNESHQEIIGLCVDMIKAVEKKLQGIKIVSSREFIPFKRIQLNLEKGKIDVFFGFAKNAKRLKKYIFVDPPLYEVNHKIAVRANDNIKIKTFDDIRQLKGDKIILTNFGTATERFLKEQGGLDIDGGGKDISINLKKLLKGRGRFVYFHNIGLISTIKNEFKKSNIKILSHSFRKYYHYTVFSRKVPKMIIEKVRVAIKKLSENGELARIQRKYTNIQ